MHILATWQIVGVISVAAVAAFVIGFLVCMIAVEQQWLHIPTPREREAILRQKRAQARIQDYRDRSHRVRQVFTDAASKMEGRAGLRKPGEQRLGDDLGKTWGEW